MKRNWPYNKIGNLCKIKTGKLDANASSKNGLYPFFTCSKEPLRIDSYSYDEECVLIAGNGDLNVKYYKGKFDAYQRTYILTIQDGISDISMKYLFLFFQKHIEILRKNSIGGVIKYIKLGDLTTAKLPIPPLSEQQRIVEELDLLGSVIEKKKEQLKELDNLAQSIFYDMFGDPVTNEKGWKMILFGKIVVTSQIGLIRSAKQQGKDKSFAYFKMNNITLSGDVDLSNLTRVDACEEEQTKYLLKQGDFLFNTRNSYELVGKSCVYNVKDNITTLYNNNILRIIFDSTISSTYISYLFKDKFIKKQLDSIKKGTTNVWAIYYKDLSRIKILAPPLPLQQQFASKIEAIEQQKELIKQSIEEVETLFNSRMDYYFT